MQAMTWFDFELVSVHTFLRSPPLRACHETEPPTKTAAQMCVCPSSTLTPQASSPGTVFAGVTVLTVCFRPGRQGTQSVPRLWGTIR